MADPTKPSATRWYQLSLRTFLVMMLFVALVFGWLGILAHRGQVQRRAVIAINEIGGRVYSHLPTNSIQSSTWMERAFGSSAIRDIYYIELNGPQTTDASLVYLKDIPGFQGLVFQRTSVTDAGLVHLRECPNLKWLNLDGASISDAGLAHLFQLKQLSVLTINGTHVTANGIQQLQAALPNCTVTWSPGLDSSNESSDEGFE